MPETEIVAPGGPDSFVVLSLRCVTMLILFVGVKMVQKHLPGGIYERHWPDYPEKDASKSTDPRSHIWMIFLHEMLPVKEKTNEPHGVNVWDKIEHLF